METDAESDKRLGGTLDTAIGKNERAKSNIQKIVRPILPGRSRCALKELVADHRNVLVAGQWIAQLGSGLIEHEETQTSQKDLHLRV